MLMEAIVQKVWDALEAEKVGVDRLELVSSIEQGGLTPNVQTVKEILEHVSLPVQVMIRPHAKSFCYSEQDVGVIKQSIEEMIAVGASNFVFGALNKDGTVNEQLLDDIIIAYPNARFTFHRAFDDSRDVMEAYQSLVRYSGNIERILTSGGKEDGVVGKAELKMLVEQSRKTNGPVIMPGSGLNAENFTSLHPYIQAAEYHFGRGVRLNGSFQESFDLESIQIIKSTQKSS
ncbi:copper homeostasis protein CutC [Gracilibacillus salitolerans]|uniref:PF03932 family protein CutC n=1 Tax=Gracilibacillus salitolerans TaxID=2663022 RepID=A0A5Q2TUZ5_9BACI|nr:copper homeostasis protein CutC [Gracilibacillus salitolerans]QGH36618.1 copper homeostasis protein CutC [Gracilibacillus salitolerans]